MKYVLTGVIVVIAALVSTYLYITRALYKVQEAISEGY